VFEDYFYVMLINSSENTCCPSILAKKKQSQLTLCITARNTPCGEGPRSWNLFQIRIHKCLIDRHSPSESVKQNTFISIEPGVEVEVTTADPYMTQ
uniref:Small ribosomal subunit protein uS10 domain-containing protein n=1 Tax=Neolamprologus brichardi TaxID=32507 RepID=A0A3Q4MX30_NEOBR